jgi:broad specificity phosphatase PhoE
MTIQIAILRHGAVQGRAHVFRGTSNEPLSALGLAQMQRALARIAGAPFDTLATSPLPRCHQFATDYAAQQQLPLQVMPCFSELDFGEWEGLTPDEAAARNPSEYAAFRATHGAHAPPDGETLAAFRTRIAQGWRAWMDQGGGSHRLLVTHAGVMRALLMELLGLTPAQTFQIALPEAACLRISHLHGQPPFLLSLN